MLKEHLSFEEFLMNEAYVNLFAGEFDEYIDDVWDIMQTSYKNIPGGFLGANSKEELMKKSAMWKLVRRGGKIVAAKLYKDLNGRKGFALGTDGSKQGKRDAVKLVKDGIKTKREWAEVSGKMEEIMKSFGAEPIPAKFAAELTGKEIEKIDKDGFHYWRIIHGVKKQKIMFGSFDKNAKPLPLKRR